MCFIPNFGAVTLVLEPKAAPKVWEQKTVSFRQKNNRSITLGSLLLNAKKYADFLAWKRVFKSSFDCLPKCWYKPKMHSQQIWTFYVLPISRYCSLKLAIFLLFQCCHFVSIVEEDSLLKSWLEFTWKAANLHLWFFTTELTTLPKTLIESHKQAVTSWNFVCSWQPWQNF